VYGCDPASTSGYLPVVRRVLLLALIWGWSFLFIKVAVQGMTPTTVAGARVFLGMVVVLVALRLRGLSLPRDLTVWRHFAVMGLIYSAIPFTLLAWGEQRTTSALASVLNASTGLFAALAGAVMLAERLRRPQLVGVGLGFVGVALASGLGPGDVAHSSVTGASATVAASACYGFAFAYAQRNLTGIPPLIAAGGQLVAATVITAPFAIFTSVAHGLALTPTRAVSILLLGMVGTGYAYLLNYRSTAELGATKASLVTYFVAVIAVTVGVLFLHEPFDVRLVLGAVLVVLGVLLVQERIRRFGPAPVLGLLVLFALLLGGCGRSRSPAAAECTPVVEEQVDPRSGFHVLPGTTPPTYLSNPPTSGPHAAGVVPSGRLRAPLAPQFQVQLLERGEVLFAYRDLTSSERAGVEALAGAGVTVLPDASAPDRVVATAWVHKMLCGGVNEVELRRFRQDWGGKTKATHPVP
jgi:drug/metabolite transporter (DMT)-like permease